MNDLDEIVSALRSAGDQLADLAMSQLRQAIRAEPELQAVLRAAEKRLTRARRSVEKAISLLEGRDSEV